MPAPYARRDAIQSLARAVNRTALGQAQGRFRGLSPTATGVANTTVIDAISGSTARLSKVDEFTVAATPSYSYTLTFEPIDDSWNVSIGGGVQMEAAYAISGRSLTFDPAAKLRTGDPIRIQYDYLAGRPGEAFRRDDPEFITANHGEVSGSLSMDLTMPNGILEGDLMLIMAARWGATIPAGWDVVETLGGAPGMAVWSRVATGPSVGEAGPEVDPTITFTEHPTHSNFNGAAVAIYRNVDTDDPFGQIETDTVTGEVSSSYIDVPQVTTTGAGQIVVYCVYHDSNEASGEGYVFAPTVTEQDAFGTGGRFNASISDEITTGAGLSTYHTLHDTSSDSSTDHRWHMVTLLLNGAPL